MASGVKNNNDVANTSTLAANGSSRFEKVKASISGGCQKALGTLQQAASDTLDYCKNPIQGNKNQLLKLGDRLSTVTMKDPNTGKIPALNQARGGLIVFSILLLLGLQLLFKRIAYCGSKIAGVFQKQTGQNGAANGTNGNANEMR